MVREMLASVQVHHELVNNSCKDFFDKSFFLKKHGSGIESSHEEEQLK